MPRPLLVVCTCLLLSATARAENATGGPDPHEIPLPLIQTSFAPKPGPDVLPVQKDLPNPLVRSSGAPITTTADWEQQRRHIRDVLEYYAVGHAPPPPGNVIGRELKSQTLAGGKFSYRLVHLSFGPERKLGLDIGIFTPTGAGPFPAVIAPGGTPPGATALPRLPNGPTQGKGVDVLLVVGRGEAANANASEPPNGTGKAESAKAPKGPWGGPADPERIAGNSVALQRGYAYVIFNYNDCGEDTTLREADGGWSYRTTRFFPAYPQYDWGLLRAWAWGVSRIVDYLETDPAIDRTKLIVTGASRTGKSAMVAAAFEDRLAMGAPVVTGGGGIGAFRFAGARGSESLDVMVKKYPNWFSPHLHEFWGKVDRLPFDEHWFLALCAPRPFIALEGRQDVISLPEAVKASIDAAMPVYALYHAENRLGVNYAPHAHAFTADDWNAMLDFADLHLSGKKLDRRFDEYPTLPAQP